MSLDCTASLLNFAFKIQNTAAITIVLRALLQFDDHMLISAQLKPLQLLKYLCRNSKDLDLEEMSSLARRGLTLKIVQTNL